MNKFSTITHSIELYEGWLADIEEKEKELVAHAIKASKNAYAPYSNFSVGAAIALSNGLIIIGNNQENIAYPSGLCAERVAIFSAAAQYPKAIIKTIAITANSNAFDVKSIVTPCGACRQVMAEYEQKQAETIKVILHGPNDRIQIIKSASSLLPFLFNEQGLKK